MTCAHAKMWLAALACGGLMGCGGGATHERSRPRANILIITIDTLRADRLGLGWTPTLDRLAAAGLHFTNARSVAPLTGPAHATILTGQLPPSHGVRLNGHALAPGASTMAQRLKQAGYQTAAVVAAFVLDRRFGLSVGFDQYDDAISRDPGAVDRLQADRPASQVVDRAIAALDRLSADQPWLLWVHLYDPHAPYDPPAGARARAQGDGYNGEIAYVDQQVARVLAATGARSDAARVVTLIMGDHGESLGDHGEATHGMLLTDAALRIPLIIHVPGRPAAMRADPASLLDVLPTVLALCDQALGTLQGRVLTGAPAPEAETYAEATYPLVAGWAPMQSLVQDRWKLVRAERPRLFDLAADPGETTDLAASKSSVVRAMSGRLDTIGSVDAAGAAGAPVSSDTVERLRGLGYVAQTGSPTGTGSGIYSGDMMADWTAFERAQALVAEGLASKGLTALARVTAAHPSSPLFASAYALALASAGQSAQALAQFRAAVKQWPTNAELYHDLAVVARSRGLGAEALRAEDAALAIDAGLSSAHHGRGLSLTEAGRHADAAVAFAEAARVDPTNAVYHTDLGNARRALGDLDAAALAYRTALTRAPLFANAANGLGAVLVQQGKAAEAVQWLERAAQEEGFIEAQLNLGIALQESGQLSRARDQYRKVLVARGRHPKEKDAARTLLSQLEKR